MNDPAKQRQYYLNWKAKLTPEQLEEKKAKDRASSAKWREANLEAARQATRKWRADNPEKVKADNHERYLKMTPEDWERKRERDRLYSKTFSEDQRKQHRGHTARYRDRHREELRQRKRERHAYLMEHSPQYVVECRLRARLQRAIKLSSSKKTAGTMELVGCTGAEVKAYIESKFLPGMSWENRREWHIDHIRPIASFDLTDPEQQKTCFHYTNLQPLWAQDNLSKSDTVGAAST